MDLLEDCISAHFAGVFERRISSISPQCGIFLKLLCIAHSSPVLHFFSCFPQLLGRALCGAFHTAQPHRLEFPEPFLLRGVNSAEVLLSLLCLSPGQCPEQHSSVPHDTSGIHNWAVGAKEKKSKLNSKQSLECISSGPAALGKCSSVPCIILYNLSAVIANTMKLFIQ